MKFLRTTFWAVLASCALTSVASALPPISGIGINCHSTRLPLDKLRAIGVRWVRLDLGGNDYTVEKLRPLVDYYRDFGQLWILPQTVPNVTIAAKNMLAAGITDIEVFNEPKMWQISPLAYAGSFKAARKAVGTKAKLYGPALGTWAQEKVYLSEILAQGVSPDVLTFHGYWQSSVSQIGAWALDARKYGMPVVVSELGFPTHLGPSAYRSKMGENSLGELFVQTKRALGSTPWCWYDGPNPADDHDSGLFDWVGGRYQPNHNYQDVVRALANS